MGDWHFADIFETIAGAVPDRPAIISGEHVTTWAAFDRRAEAVAVDLLDAGLGRASKVGVYLPNSAEYLEAYHAAAKIAAWPFNTNYRYGPDEIVYLFDNADTEAVVFHTRFTDVVETIRPRLTDIKRWYAVGPAAERPAWAVDYERVASSGATLGPPAWPRTPDDVVLTYTGGTTGMPKGVMWSHGELFAAMGQGGNPVLGYPPVADRAELADAVTSRDPVPVVLEACPLMHATALGNAYALLAVGGTVVLLDSSSFDAAEVWDVVDRRSVAWLTMVGDAFGRPLVAALEANPGRWRLDSLRIVYSAGVMWSREVKEAMLAHLRDDAMLIDVLGSTEAAGMGRSVSTKGAVAPTASFMVGELAQVLTEDGRFVEPGSGEVGLAAFGGPMPSGYYKDPKKSAETFRTVDGARWSVPGDHATVEADGTMRLLGRGSVCINTGGEKVFVEEVEEVLKLHPQVADAVCVGIPHERFGETVCAVVEPAGPGPAVDAGSVIELVKGRLAGFKAPRDVVVVDSIRRAPSGKVDYASLRALARERLGR
jgi:3-oxocholest-4-en-26-oate---CoA ligase